MLTWLSLPYCTVVLGSRGKNLNVCCTAHDTEVDNFRSQAVEESSREPITQAAEHGEGLQVTGAIISKERRLIFRAHQKSQNMRPS